MTAEAAAEGRDGRGGHDEKEQYPRSERGSRWNVDLSRE